MISRAPSGGGGGGSYVPGDSAVGNAIAQKALTRLGCRYWWGANGPNYFDCSGLVYWAYNQAGVSLGRTTAAGYAGSGKAISRSELQLVMYTRSRVLVMVVVLLILVSILVVEVLFMLLEKVLELLDNILINVLKLPHYLDTGKDMFIIIEDYINSKINIQ